MAEKKRIALAAFLLLFPFLALAAQDAGLSVSTVESAYPGDEVRYDFSCANNGTGNRSGALGTEGLPPAFRTLFVAGGNPAQKVDLDRADSATVSLTVEVPADAEPGRYGFDVLIGEQRVSEVLIVGQVNNLTIDTVGSVVSVLPGKSVDIPVTFGNGGSVALSEIKASVSVPGNWKYSLSKSSAPSLARGESFNAVLTLTIPQKESPGIKKVTITAASGNSPATDRYVNLEVKQPLGILWILLAIIGAGLAVLFAANRKYGRR